MVMLLLLITFSYQTQRRKEKISIDTTSKLYESLKRYCFQLPFQQLFDRKEDLKQ